MYAHLYHTNLVSSALHISGSIYAHYPLDGKPSYSQTQITPLPGFRVRLLHLNIQHVPQALGPSFQQELEKSGFTFFWGSSIHLVLRVSVLLPHLHSIESIDINVANSGGVRCVVCAGREREVVRMKALKLEDSSGHPRRPTLSSGVGCRYIFNTK